MKKETYTFTSEDNQVKLEFSFPVGNEMNRQKQEFMKLLKQALQTLESEQPTNR